MEQLYHLHMIKYCVIFWPMSKTEDGTTTRADQNPLNEMTVVTGFGEVSVQGRRPEMEDEHIIIPGFRDTPDEFFAGVYDGHGGGSKTESRSSKIGDRKSIKHQTSNIKNLSSIFNNQSSSTQVIIVTGDRDLLQLVNKKVLILAPVIGVTKMILFDVDKVKEKYGLPPEKIVDYKALVGDSSDNYPGVRGIGPKTASDLVSRFGSLEDIYKNLGEINPKTAEKLAQDAEQSALAKKLAKIEVNAPIKFKLSECELKNMDRQALLAEFEDLNFNSLINRFKLDQKPKVDKVKKKKPNEDQLGLL